MTSLSLSLEPLRGIVRVQRAGETTDSEWMALRLAWPDAEPVGDTEVHLELFAFLEQVAWLVNWPHPDSVEWDPQLLDIVSRNFEQRAQLERLLAGETPGQRDATASLVDSERWVGDLKPFQLRDLKKLLGLEHGANFSVPGAGKTRTTLALYEVERLQGRAAQMLVIAPLAAHESWLGEAQICFQQAPHIEQLGAHPPSYPTEILLTNYDRLPQSHGLLHAWCNRAPTMVVLDEAHRVKRGPSGVWGAIALALAPKAARRDVLTGTPAPQGVADLATLMQFLWLGQSRRIITEVTSARNLRDASTVLQPLFVRTTKSELHLPPMRLSVRRVSALDLHRQVYQALCGLYMGRMALGDRDLRRIGQITMYLLMAATNPALLRAGSDKHDALDYEIPPIDVPSNTTLSELIDDLPYYEAPAKYAEVTSIVRVNAERNRKTLVWSTFVRNLESLVPILADFNPAIVHGGSPGRSEQLRRFREDPRCLVLLANPAAIGEGISLHDVCRDAVYLDRDFAAGKFMQSVDRIHRLGLPPDAEVNVTLLVTTGTIDEVVEARLASKIAFMGNLLNDEAVNDLADPAEEEAATYGLSKEDVADVITHLRS